MTSKIPMDDTARPGFVSAVVMKFTNMVLNENDMSAKEMNIRSKSKTNDTLQQNKITSTDIDSRKKNILKSNPSNDSSTNKLISGKSKIYNNNSKDSNNIGLKDIPQSLNDRINVEYQVIGDVSVKDRIKAFSTLTQTVEEAVKKPEVLRSSRFASPINTSQGHVRNYCKKLTEKMSIDKPKNLARSNTLEEEVFAKAPKVCDMVSKFINNGNKNDTNQQEIGNKNMKKLTQKSNTVVNHSISPRASLSTISKVESVDRHHSTTSVDDSNYTKSLSLPSEVTSASSDNGIDSFEYDIQAKNLEYDSLMKSIQLDDNVDDGSSDSLLNEFDKSVSDKSGKLQRPTVSSFSSFSKDVDTKKYRLYDPSDNPNYSPLPRSYNVKFDLDGRLSVALPPPLKPSVLTKKSTKKNLSTKFDTSNISIMETYSYDEYERGDSSIDPLTASAEYEIEKKTEALDKFTVQITKDDRGLGMSIVGIGLGSDLGGEKLGIYIKALTPGGASDKSNKFNIQDQLLEVDGISLVGVTQAFAAQTLKATSKVVKFLVGREKTPSTG